MKILFGKNVERHIRLEAFTTARIYKKYQRSWQ